VLQYGKEQKNLILLPQETCCGLPPYWLVSCVQCAVILCVFKRSKVVTDKQKSFQ